MVNQAGAYPGFYSMKWLGVFLLPPGWDDSPSQGYPRYNFVGTHLYTVERGTVRVKCLSQEHNTISPARASIAYFSDLESVANVNICNFSFSLLTWWNKKYILFIIGFFFRQKVCTNLSHLQKLTEAMLPPGNIINVQFNFYYTWKYLGNADESFFL